MITERVRRAAIALLAARVFLQTLLGEQRQHGQHTPPPHQLHPKGAEWRHIGRLPTGRLVTVQVSIA